MYTPTQDYRRTSQALPRKPLKGIDAAVNAAIGRYQRRGRLLAALREDAEKTDALAGKFIDLTDHALQEQLLGLRESFRRGGQIPNERLFEALAAIREAAHRRTGLRAFVVQLMGALALHRGYLAEMATGEGKTLTAGLAAVLAGWTRLSCHIITVNDYLVRRDAEWLTPFYHFCGVRVGFVTGPMTGPDRLKGYGCDVTYATSKEVLADFLRDRLQLGRWQNPTQRLIRRMLMPQQAARDGVVMRGLHTAIVDEADSVLIDEAVTPLIISTSQKNESLREAVSLAQGIVGDLQPEADYRASLRFREIELTPEGRRKLAERCAALPGIWRSADRRTELVRQALVAREFFHPGKQYLLHDGKVVIVDEFTGRQMPQRTWRQGLHQAIEAKEGIEITDPSETVARLSFQRFFRCYFKISGMSGTAAEAAGELWQIYKLPVIRIPTNRPCVREHWPDRIFAGEAAKWDGIVEEISRLHRTGRPLLVGTRSINASEQLAARLKELKIDFHLLNARHVETEVHIIASAGERGRITIATNMAGRGTDIKLGEGVAALGGLHVLATERHEAGRVDRQLFGRAARQGDPGSAQAFVSAEDELIRRHLPAPVRELLLRSLRGRLPARERVAKAAFSLAQRKAQSLAYRQRLSVLRTDTWLEESLSFAGEGA